MIRQYASGKFNNKNDEFLVNFLNKSINFELVKEWISNNTSPSDIFSDTVLQKWALENGYAQTNLIIDENN